MSQNQNGISIRFSSRNSSQNIFYRIASQCGYEDPKMPKYEGVCIEEVELCYGTDDYSIYNETMQKQCKEQGCYTCKDVSTVETRFKKATELFLYLSVSKGDIQGCAVSRCSLGRA